MKFSLQPVLFFEIYKRRVLVYLKENKVELLNKLKSTFYFLRDAESNY